MIRATVQSQTQGEPEADVQGISRRELLYCGLCASGALAAAGACAGVTWFAQPRPVLNRDVLEIDLDSIPKSLARPTKIAGAYYLVRLPAGLIALHWLCPHLGSAVKWSEENTRFECVSHGGRYTLDGSYLTGPARRDMDQFVLHITTPDGTISTPADGSPVPIDDALSVVLDTRTKILGKPAVRRER